MKMAGLSNAFRGFDINNLDVKQAGNWPVGIKFITYVLAFSLVSAAGIHFFIKDKHEAIEREITRESGLKRELEDKSFRVANLDALRRQMLDVEERFEEILKQLPTDKEIPQLLEDISDIGRQAGLSIETIALQPEVASQFYIELPINIQVTGSYHQMGEFVSGIAAIERIVTLHNFTIKSGNNADLNMTINAKTYRYEQN